jgi:hypothetical protein
MTSAQRAKPWLHTVTLPSPRVEALDPILATATLTLWIGGSESNRQSYCSPPSRPIQS